jgi:hypothetical protein
MEQGFPLREAGLYVLPEKVGPLNARDSARAEQVGAEIRDLRLRRRVWVVSDR